MHSDTGFAILNDAAERGLLLTCFVYLDDVGPGMAALDVFPGSHKDWHFTGSGATVGDHGTAVRMEVPAGSIVIMDSRAMHRPVATASAPPAPPAASRQPPKGWRGRLPATPARVRSLGGARDSM